MEAAATQNNRRRLRRVSGYVLLAIGVILLAVSGGFYAYGAWATSKLDGLTVTRERPVEIRETQTRVTAPDVASWPGREPVTKADIAHALKGPVAPIIANWPRGAARNVRTEKLGVGASFGPKPQSEGNQTTAKADSSPIQGGDTAPRWVGDMRGVAFEDPGPRLIAEIVEASKVEAAGYLRPSAVSFQSASLAPATRIRIPAVNIDSTIKELEVVRTADSSAWETPKHIVGHIPTTSVAGGNGQGWYFGHLESPIRGEGNVFQRLPEIADLLKSDASEPIYIFLESDDQKFVYQVYLTRVVPQEDLRISDSGARDITLVTCTPRFVYDHRLMVTAALVGVLGS